jgi:ubiquinone/menaquinone biosynthesis C-methylase UbiE
MQTDIAAAALEFTGERMVPEGCDPDTFWQHIYRYRFASRFVAGKAVLDIACGEGYGSAALEKAGAASVVGVDISEEACAHARQKYGIDARQGSAENIPLPDGSVDAVVSFETIEHVEKPGKLLDECFRVLRPGGRLIVSTPNRDIYTEPDQSNPYHCSEMNESEFESLLSKRFPRWRMYVQMPNRAPWWSATSIAAVSSPWLNLKGFYRARKMLRAVLCPHINGEVSEQYRGSPIDAVLGKDRALSTLANQYAVRRRPASRAGDFIFYLAVAER